MLYFEGYFSGMSYFSDKEYKGKREGDNFWFEELYFNRWFREFSDPILDVGCATGNFIAIKPNLIEGIDIDEDSLAVARSRGFKVRKVDAQKPLEEVESSRYQGVYVKHVIEHLPDPLSFLREVKRILKPGGKVVILTPNCPYMFTRGFWDDYTHVRPFTKRSLEMVAYDAGFRGINISEDFRCFPGLGLLMRAFRISPRVLRFIQSILFIRGLSLIAEVVKE